MAKGRFIGTRADYDVTEPPEHDAWSARMRKWAGDFQDDPDEASPRALTRIRGLAEELLAFAVNGSESESAFDSFSNARLEFTELVRRLLPDDHVERPIESGLLGIVEAENLLEVKKLFDGFMGSFGKIDPNKRPYVDALQRVVEASPTAQALTEKKPPESDKLDGYVLASKIWPQYFKTYRQFQTWLDKNPQVRRIKPSKYRLWVHAADVADRLADRGESLKTAADEEEMLTEIERRTAMVRRGSRPR